MSQSITNSLAGLAAVLLAFTSISAITTIPPAQAQSVQVVINPTELA